MKKIGFEASKKFKEEPTKKANKLKKLSPHWLRHLCASHQDKAGLSSTMIKDNLRHGSIQTSQIYKHAEDRLRHEAMQKMSLAVNPKSMTRKTVSSQTVISIQLTLEPAHKGLGFKKLVGSLEGDVFSGYQWQPYQFEKEKIIEEIEVSIMPIKTINFAYIIENLAQEHIEGLKKGIALEASVRLFKADVETNIVRV